MPTNTILGHVRNYATAGLISAIVGVISFPIMTRNLSVDDYGIIGLITASTTLAVAFGKLGMQHAIVRFYAEAMLNKRGNTLLAFHSTVFSLFATLSLITLIIWLTAGTFVVPRFIENPDIPVYFWIVSLFIVLRMIGSVTWNMLRARQLSTAVSYSTIIGRCAYLSLLLLLLATGTINLYFLLVAFVLAELAAVIYATHAYRSFFSFRLPDFSSSLTLRLLRFGLPLMVLESLSLILRLIDRYMIGSVLGEKDLGLYSASYNLSSYVEIVITASLAAAIRPMYTHIWESEGADATRNFLSQSLHIYLMLGIPFTAVFIMAAPDLLVFLASERYGSGASIIPYIATIILLDGALIFLSAGMYFLGSTNTLLFWGIVAGIINCTGNYFVIPRFGIEGAAIVTLCAFLVFCTGFLNSSLRLLSFAISWKKPLIMLIVSILVYVITNRTYVDTILLNMIIKAGLATASLLLVLLTVDSQVRNWMHTRLQNFRPAALSK